MKTFILAVLTSASLVAGVAAQGDDTIFYTANKGNAIEGGLTIGEEHAFTTQPNTPDQDRILIGIDFKGFPEDERPRQTMRLFLVSGRIAMKTDDSGTSVPYADLEIIPYAKSNEHGDWDPDTDHDWIPIHIQRDELIREHSSYGVHLYAWKKSTPDNQQFPLFVCTVLTVLGLDHTEFRDFKGKERSGSGLDLAEMAFKVGLQTQLNRKIALRFTVFDGGFDANFPFGGDGPAIRAQFYSELALLFKNSHFQGSFFARGGGRAVQYRLPKEDLPPNQEFDQEGYWFSELGLRLDFSTKKF